MESEQRYELPDGTPCTLETLCRKEPEWAAGRLRHERKEASVLRARVAELGAALLACCEAVEEVGEWGEDGEPARVCEACGGGDEASVEDPALAHQDDCPFGRARNLLTKETTNDK